MNEVEHYIYEFVLVFISLSAFYLFKTFWPKYFETKGANQATKEDIGEITKIVEKIKSDLSQQNELLKAQLSLTNQHKLNIKTAEREAIFDFNRQKSVWLYSLVRFSFYKYNIENYKETIQLTYLDFQKRQYEFDLAEAHLVLLFHDEAFFDLNKRLIEEITELNKIALQTTYDLFYVFSKAELSFAVETKPLEQSKIRYNLNEELLSVHNKHKELTTMQFEKVNPLDVEMRELLCSRLKILDHGNYS
jgi:hypothetical protein